MNWGHALGQFWLWSSMVWFGSFIAWEIARLVENYNRRFWAWLLVVMTFEWTFVTCMILFFTFFNWLAGG